MIRGIRNRAYRFLDKVLDLEGTQHLGDIDIGTAFPVHDLDPIIKAGQVLHFLGIKSLVTNASTSNFANFSSLRDPQTSFDSLYVREGGQLLGPQTRLPDDWTVLLVNTLAYSATGTFGAKGMWAFALPGSRLVPITSELATTVFSIIMPLSGGNYYATPMPQVVTLEKTLRYYQDQDSGTDHTTACVVEFLAAPPGVMAIPGDYP